MKIFFMVVAVVYILYLLFLIVRACSELRHMPYVGKSHFTKAQDTVGQQLTSRGGGVAGGHQTSGLNWRGTQGLVPFPQAGATAGLRG